MLTAALLAGGCAGFGPPSGGVPGPAGTYEGQGPGFRGPVRVAVRLDEGGVADIRILEHGDDEAVGGAAMEELADLVLLYNTTDLDAISGATQSSEGFLRAVEDALCRAGYGTF
jgi:uncharacterized protein with FMN-binding domain